MGLRYRKSVRICKGVRVNFSKSGASLSVGGHGYTTSFSGRGIRTTTGIPGTGISYSSMYRSHNQSTAGAKTQTPLPDVVHCVMDDRGKVTFQYKDGSTITDAALIRRIKAQPQVKTQIEALDIQRRSKINEYVRISEEENERFVALYRLTPRVKNAEEFEREYRQMQPEVYHEKSFSTGKPSQIKIREILEEEAKREVKASIFKVKKLRSQYVEKNFPLRYNNALQEWQREKTEFETA